MQLFLRLDGHVKDKRSSRDGFTLKKKFTVDGEKVLCHNSRQTFGAKEFLGGECQPQKLVQ